MSEVIDPITLSGMSTEELEIFITQLRERRATVIKRLNSARRSHAETDSQILRRKLEGKILKLSKAVQRIEIDFIKAERLIADITTLRLQYGETPERILE